MTVHSVLGHVPRPTCYSRSPPPRGCGLSPVPPAPCERVGPDPVLGVRSSHFSHKTPLSPGRGPSPQPRSPGRGGALSWLGWLRSNGLFFTACQFLNCVAISFFMEKKKKKRNRKWFRLIYLHKCRRRILSKLLHKYWNCLFFHGAGGRWGFLLTCLFSDHAAAKLSEVEWRGTGGQGPWDFKACFFPFSLLFSPCSSASAWTGAPPFSPLSPGLSLFI